MQLQFLSFLFSMNFSSYLWRMVLKMPAKVLELKLGSSKQTKKSTLRLCYEIESSVSEASKVDSTNQCAAGFKWWGFKQIWGYLMIKAFALRFLEFPGAVWPLRKRAKKSRRRKGRHPLSPHLLHPQLRQPKPRPYCCSRSTCPFLGSGITQSFHASTMGPKMITHIHTLLLFGNYFPSCTGHLLRRASGRNCLV